jgi:hypothetical protein
MPKQLTIRGVSPEAARRLERVSTARGLSVNAAVLSILESALGVNERRRRLVQYATWNEDDVAEFERALANQRQIDGTLWQ